MEKIISTRNRLIHGYDSISYSTVWSIVKQNLPTLKLQLDTILANPKLDSLTII